MFESRGGYAQVCVFVCTGLYCASSTQKLLVGVAVMLESCSGLGLEASDLVWLNSARLGHMVRD